MEGVCGQIVPGIARVVRSAVETYDGQEPTGERRTRARAPSNWQHSTHHAPQPDTVHRAHAERGTQRENERENYARIPTIRQYGADREVKTKLAQACPPTEGLLIITAVNSNETLTIGRGNYDETVQFVVPNLHKLLYSGQVPHRLTREARQQPSASCNHHSYQQSANSAKSNAGSCVNPVRAKITSRSRPDCSPFWRQTTVSSLDVEVRHSLFWQHGQLQYQRGLADKDSLIRFVHAPHSTLINVTDLSSSFPTVSLRRPLLVALVLDTSTTGGTAAPSIGGPYVIYMISSSWCTSCVVATTAVVLPLYGT
ncbi:hypothetical protein ON010_g12044 [Phytophthora cinnamomi]|nr:hypothetical protein ON010_g12044 [Phytophthora cinnamomi]